MTGNAELIPSIPFPEGYLKPHEGILPITFPPEKE